MTIALLDHDGYRPTVMDLAGLTGLPKSNVSRYLSSQLKKGYLTEQIDKSDRRRRIYTPTAAGRKEMDFLKRKIAAISSSIGKDSKDLFSVLSKFAAEKT